MLFSQMDKRGSVSLCDIRLQVLDGGSIADISPMGPSKPSLNQSKIGAKENSNLPLDDIHYVVKRKRLEMEKENKENKESSDEEEVDEKPKKKIVKIIPEAEKEVNVKPKKKIVKIVSETEEESEGDESDEDSDTYMITRSDTVKKKSRLNKTPKPKTTGMSAYEKMIEQNRAKSLAFLQSLKINEVKSELSDAVNAIKKKKKVDKPIKRHNEKKEIPLLPVRKSRRLAKMTADLSEDSLFENAVRSARLQSEANYNTPIPSKLTFKEALSSEELYKTFMTDITIQESKEPGKNFSYNRSVVQNLTLEDFNIAKVVPERITSLTWYPSADHLILAAASKYGNIGIWNVDSESNPYVFKIHNEGATHLQFSQYDPVKLFSSSYDGSLRCGDLVKHMFNEVFNVSDKTSCTYFDFVSSTTFVVALRNGHIALVDRRDTKSCEKMHPCHDYSVKTVNVHPVNKNFILTAENKGSVRLWDLRKLQKNPVADINYHGRCVNSAFFSTATGNSILTTSFDDSICIFDSKNLTQDIKMIKRMKHNNNTGRWLSIFRATWLPNSDDAFVVGSMNDSPRRIQVFDKDLNVYHLLMHENLTTITSVNIFHPFRPALAGSNSSGKVYVFTPSA